MKPRLMVAPVISFALAASVAIAQQAEETPVPGPLEPTAPAGQAETPTAPAPAPGDQPAVPSAEPPQTTAPGAVAPLPEVEVIQKAPQPAPPPAAAPQPKQKAAAPQPVPVTAPAAPTPAAVAAPAPVAAPAAVQPGEAEAAEDNIRMSPLAGSEIPRAKVPASVSVVTASEVEREGTGQIQQVLQSQVPGIVLSDAAGNPLRAEVSYRGFDASPVGGRPQGLAVYQNGVRINEAFGDTVNWEVLPSNAIESLTVISNNPVFGLNAIGGAISIVMKDGFSYQGAEVDVLGGSFGRAQIGVQAGLQHGPAAAYIAAEGIREDGFRDFSDSEIQRMYVDLGLKGSKIELHVSLTGADNSFGVTAAAPRELLDLSWSRTFTSPQVTDIEVLMPQINGSLKATDTLTFAGVAYYRRLKSNVIDGNLTEIDECDPAGPNAGLLCLEEEGEDEEELVLDATGNPIDDDDLDEPLGSIERINTLARSWGGTLQAVEKAPLFGRPNQLLVGASYDHGRVSYTTSSELGTIGDKFVVVGSGIIVSEPDDVAPRDLVTKNDYVGLYFSNTMDVTDRLAVTVGGRYNYAQIELTDRTGDFPELNATNTYERFNPMAGATYRLWPTISIYGGYSEANRAPTAAELGCAEPDNPCFIESFLTDDPPLEQVVARSVEAGIRGEHKAYDGQRLNWSLGYFRTRNSDDILAVAAEQTGRGFFLNAGDTLRQGLEAAIRYENSRLTAYASYALVNATFEDSVVLPAPNTPTGTEDCPGVDGPEPAQCNFVRPGDRLPGIPLHRFKAGFTYWVTPRWQIGSDLVAASDQVFFGDEANNNPELPGYVRVDLNTSYDVTKRVQVYGLIRNLFDSRYGLYGTFFNTEEASEASTEGFEFEDARSITPALPFAAYGGVKVRF